MSVTLVGRSSSHFTRVARIFALELGVALELEITHDITLTDPAAFAGNPALKIPTLRRDGSQLFGTENICRALAELAPGKRIVWPEQLRDDLSRNAQELVWHAMAAQVQFVIGTMVNKLPADNAYFVKIRAGLEGALRWLDDHLARALEALPPRDLSLFEVTLFCLIEHLTFRGSLSVEPYPNLVAFAQRFSTRESAKQTTYRFDPKPG